MSLAVAANAVLDVCAEPQKGQSNQQWLLCALDREKGTTLWEEPLPSEPLLDSLLIDRHGQVIVALKNGSIVCYGAKR